MSIQDEPAAMSKPESDGELLFRGLRVRMSIASGTADQTKVSG